MTHEEYQAILKFSDEIIPQLKILDEKSMMDVLEYILLFLFCKLISCGYRPRI